MKQCGRCKQEKNLNSFSWKNQEKNLLQSYCRECNKKNLKCFYENNRNKFLERNKTRKILIRKLVFEFLQTHPCVDCGEKDPIVLEFDHVNPSTKTQNISRMVIEGYSWKSIEKEIKKCQILCSNCHKRKTAREQNWYLNIQE
jgi:5-methylcytosine-specific restriction endonuclease McrA